MILGTFIFLFGMIAFNAGSQGSISQPGDGFVIAKVSINTLICAMTSAATALIYQRFIVDRLKKNWNYTSGINGSFVGMVYITICSFVSFKKSLNADANRSPYALDVIGLNFGEYSH